MPNGMSSPSPGALHLGEPPVEDRSADRTLRPSSSATRCSSTHVDARLFLGVHDDGLDNDDGAFQLTTARLPGTSGGAAAPIG